MVRLSKILYRIGRKNEGGFALIELLIAIAISGILLTGISAAVLQVIAVKALSANILTATKQIDNAFHWMTRDGQMCNGTALKKFVDEATEEDPFLRFQWEWDDGFHVVTYEAEENQLYRKHTINSLPAGRTLIAEFIDFDQSDRYWVIQVFPDDSTQEIFKVKITAYVGGYKGAGDTRILDITPRLTY